RTTATLPNKIVYAWARKTCTITLYALDVSPVVGGTAPVKAYPGDTKDYNPITLPAEQNALSFTCHCA
ncbi:hypothetical protein PMAYCL1PPCAC_27261, partial [Pristionchus mayeri]